MATRPRPSQCLAPPKNRSILPPVLDIRESRDNPEHVRERLATRGDEFAAKVDDAVRLDAVRREAITAVEELKATRNAASKEIGALMGQKKTDEAEAKKAEVRDIADQISALDSQAAQADGELRDILLRLPNLPHANVPVGDSEDTSFGDFIEDKSAENPTDMASYALLKDRLGDVLTSLTERERKVLELRFGLADGYSRTLEEVGKQFKVTRERIRQIEAKALRKMRHPTRIRQLSGFLEREEFLAP